MIHIRYFDRQKNEIITLHISADCVDVILDGHVELPPLSVTVNTDAVRIHQREDGRTGKVIGGLDYADLIADAEGAGEL